MDKPSPAPTPNKASDFTAWPGAFGIYPTSCDAVRLNLLMLVELFVVAVAISLLLSNARAGVPGQLIANLVSLVVSVMVIRTQLHGVRGQKVTWSDLFNDDLPLLSLKMLGLGLLLILIAAGSLLLFIVPFFFVMPRLTLASYFLVDKNMGITEAINASWQATKGNVGKVYGILGVNLLMWLLMITIVGIPIAIYLIIMYSASSAVLYEFVNRRPAAPAQA